MIRQFFKDSLIYGIAGILSRGVPLILVPFFTRVLSPEDYGIIDLLTIIAAIVNLVVALEISQGFARYYADTKKHKEKTLYASSALWFTCVSYLIFLGIAIIAAKPINQLLFETQKWIRVWQIAVVAMVFNGVFYLSQDILRWQLKPKKYSIASLVYTVISAVISFYLILYLKFGIISIYVGQITGAVLGGLFALRYSHRILKFKVDLGKLLEMIRFSLPLVPSSIAVFFSLFIDRIFIRYSMTLSDVGIYGIGYRFASIILLFFIGVQASLTPLIYHHYKDPGTPIEIARLFRFCILPVIFLFISVSVYSIEIITLFTPKTYYAAWSVIPILCLSIFINNLYIFAPGLPISKKTNVISTLNITAAFVNIILNSVLIPIYGIIGAAIATCTASIISFVSQMYFSQKLYFVPHHWKNLMLSFTVSIVAITLGLSIGKEGVIISIQNILLKLVIITLASIIIFFTILNHKEIQTLLHKMRPKTSKYLE